MTTTSPSETASRNGQLWGSRAEDWAGNEDQQVPTYEEALRRVGLAAGARVLDVGCGSGVFLRLAADRGARTAGVDASAALLELGRRRVPDAELVVADMQSLPFEDDAFDLVTGFNSFFFAADMTEALREARRVARPGAPVVVQVWGAPDRCDLTAMKRAVGALLPPDPAVPAAPGLWEPGALERIAAEAGLTPEEAFDSRWAYEFADDEALARAMLSPGLIVEAASALGEERVRAAILEGLAPYRGADGAYRLENEWHYLVARA